MTRPEATRHRPRPVPVAVYEFRVAGHLDYHWSAWFGEVPIARLDDGTSTLTVAVADQAELHGYLARLRDLGVALLLLRLVEGDGPTDRSSASCLPAR